MSVAAIQTVHLPNLRVLVGFSDPWEQGGRVFWHSIISKDNRVTLSSILICRDVSNVMWIYYCLCVLILYNSGCTRLARRIVNGLVKVPNNMFLTLRSPMPIMATGGTGVQVGSVGRLWSRENLSSKCVRRKHQSFLPAWSPHRAFSVSLASHCWLIWSVVNHVRK